MNVGVAEGGGVTARASQRPLEAAAAPIAQLLGATASVWALLLGELAAVLAVRHAELASIWELQHGVGLLITGFVLVAPLAGALGSAGFLLLARAEASRPHRVMLGLLLA